MPDLKDLLSDDDREALEDLRTESEEDEADDGADGE